MEKKVFLGISIIEKSDLFFTVPFAYLFLQSCAVSEKIRILISKSGKYTE